LPKKHCAIVAVSRFDRFLKRDIIEVEIREVVEDAKRLMNETELPQLPKCVEPDWLEEAERRVTAPNGKNRTQSSKFRGAISSVIGGNAGAINWVSD
jgi:hypothetical protein